MLFLDRLLKRDTLEIRVAMVGPRRAGKTSMLSAMFERFENALLAEKVADKVCLAADPDTADVLSANYTELIRTIREGGNIAGAITGDSEAHSYGFDLKRRRDDQDVQIRLSFQDYPGGWLMAGERDASDSNYRKVVEFIREAQILLVAVDAPYLMEDGGRWHTRRNLPELVANTVRTAWRADDPTPRTVLLVPIKCEKYDRTAVGHSALVESTRRGYGELLDHLGTLPRCAVVCAPAQTTGCIAFDHFLPMEDGDEIPAPVFTMPKELEARGYNPKDCSQALRWSLVYALKRYVKEGEDGIAGKVRTFFKLDRKFTEGADIIGSGCRGTVFQTMKGGGGTA